MGKEENITMDNISAKSVGWIKDAIQSIETRNSMHEYNRFNDNVLKSARVLENSLSEYITRSDENLSTNILLNHTKDVILSSDHPKNTFRMLRRVRRYDDTTFIHSLNVAILCNAFGQWMRMSEDELDVLTLAGLLHDVGKMKIPEEIVKKPEGLTEEEYSVIKQHTKRGYQILKDLPLDERIKNVALMHHERCDGKGYPAGLAAEEIDDFAKIVAIADVFDALTSARVYRGPLTPFEGFRIMRNGGYEQFKKEYLITFMEGITRAYTGSLVLLSDGREAEIAHADPRDYSRPIVRIQGNLIKLSEEEIDICEIVRYEE